MISIIIAGGHTPFGGYFEKSSSHLLVKLNNWFIGTKFSQRLYKAPEDLLSYRVAIIINKTGFANRKRYF
jgi:hypothetical protein